MLEGPNHVAPQSQGNDDSLELELLARTNRGDRAAFRELYTRYYHPLLRFIYRMTGQLELAKEGINDVMLVVWTNGRSFHGRSRVSTWIMGIAYRKAMKLLEKSRRWSERFASADFPQSGEPFAQIAGPIASTDLQDLLEHGMRELSTKQRAVVELTYYYGYSYEEIAVIADCPVNTVKTRMFHARAKLKRILPQLADPQARATE
jgi:RNA polymerase sigma-70 factor (ECF subfamily)